MKGAYILVVKLSTEIQIKIGALGNIFFEKGYYFYIGSAMAESGASTLINRLLRHLREPELKKIHWHIDYFLQNTNTEIVKLILIPSKIKIECELIKMFDKTAKYGIENFGCSDCRCNSHLLYFRDDIPL